MKKCLIGFLFLATFFIGLVISTNPSIYISANAPVIIENQYDFYCYDDLSQNLTLNVDLRGADLLSLTCQGTELKHYEYSYNQGEIVLYKSFLLSLNSGINTFTVNTEGGTGNFDVNIIRQHADFDKDFGKQGSGGWYYYCYDYGLSRLIYADLPMEDSNGKINFWSFKYDPSIMLYRDNAIFGEKKSIIVYWKPPFSGTFDINCNITKIQTTLSNGIASFIYLNNTEIDFYYFDPSLFSTNNYIYNYSNSMTINETDVIKFEIYSFSNSNGNNFDLDITIKYPQYNVNFYDGEDLYRSQIISHNQKAALPEVNPEKMYSLFNGYKDSNGNPFDFDTAITENINLYTSWKEIPVSAEDITITTQGNTIYLSTEQKQNCLYQFWVMSQITSDGSEENMSRTGKIWRLIQPFSSSSTAILPSSFTSEGDLKVLIRINDGGNIFQLYKTFGYEDIHKDKIYSFMVNEKFILDGIHPQKKGGSLNICVNGSEGLNYFLYIENQLTDQNETGIFNIDTFALPCGYSKFTITAYNGNEECDQVSFNSYIYDDFDPKSPVFYDFNGISDTNGNTTFTLKVKCADGTNILPQNASQILVSLYSESIKLPLTESLFENGIYTLRFQINYNNMHGIYRIHAKAQKQDLNYHDTLIKYYSGYAREAELFQSADKHLSAAGQKVNIFANGSITGENDGLLYAFFREDAGGWKMIKDYSHSNRLEWTPLKAGLYKIQARVKGVGEGSYEKAVTQEYIITDSGSLNGQLIFYITDSETNQQVTSLKAGKPYILNASAQAGDALYMFTVYNQSTGVVYLNKYSASGSLIFIADKADNYIITARAIYPSNYGYMDICAEIEISSTIF